MIRFKVMYQSIQACRDVALIGHEGVTLIGDDGAGAACLYTGDTRYQVGDIIEVSQCGNAPLWLLWSATGLAYQAPLITFQGKLSEDGIRTAWDAADKAAAGRTP